MAAALPYGVAEMRIRSILSYAPFPASALASPLRGNPAQLFPAVTTKLQPLALPFDLANFAMAIHSDIMEVDRLLLEITHKSVALVQGIHYLRDEIQKDGKRLIWQCRVYRALKFFISTLSENNSYASLVLINRALTGLTFLHLVDVGVLPTFLLHQVASKLEALLEKVKLQRDAQEVFRYTLNDIQRSVEGFTPHWHNSRVNCTNFICLPAKNLLPP